MIRRFYVHNFRCLQNFDLPIGDKPNALLIGTNGSGKSSVGLAMEVLQKIGRGETQVSQVVKSDDLSNGRREVPMRFEIVVEEDEIRYEYSIAFENVSDLNKMRVFDERFQVNELIIYSRQRDSVTLSRTESSDNVTFRMDPAVIALPILELSGDRMGYFQSWLAALIVLRPIPGLISGDSTGETLNPDPTVSNFGDWFSGVVAQTPAAYGWFETSLKDVMPDLKAVTNPRVGRDSRSLLVEFTNNSAVMKIPFRFLSDGEKIFMIHALLLALIHATSSFVPMVCFWDEPDNYVALPVVSELVMALRRAFNNNCQLLITSQNPEAIRDFSAENTILLHRRSHIEPPTTHILNTINYNGTFVEAWLRGEIEP